MSIIRTRAELDQKRKEYARIVSLQKKQILVCGGTGCVAGGSLKIYAKLKEILDEKGVPCAVRIEKDPEKEVIGLKKSGCHGFCEKGPLLRIDPMGVLYTKVKVEDCEEIVEKTILDDEVIERLLYHDAEGKPYVKQDSIPFYKNQTRVALEHCGKLNAESISEYIAEGGYQAVAKALFDMTEEEIINEITESSLRGRGGGGSPQAENGLRCFVRQSLKSTLYVTGTKVTPVHLRTVQ